MSTFSHTQIINCIPTSIIPKHMPWAKKKSTTTDNQLKYKSPDYPNESDEEEDFDEIGDLEHANNDDDDDDLKNSGQILWIRGLSRLQTQVITEMRLVGLCVCVHARICVSDTSWLVGKDHNNNNDDT